MMGMDSEPPLRTLRSRTGGWTSVRLGCDWSAQWVACAGLFWRSKSASRLERDATSPPGRRVHWLESTLPRVGGMTASVFRDRGHPRHRGQRENLAKCVPRQRFACGCRKSLILRQIERCLGVAKGPACGRIMLLVCNILSSQCGVDRFFHSGRSVLHCAARVFGAYENGHHHNLTRLVLTR